MSTSSRRRAIAVAAGLTMVAGASPALGATVTPSADDDRPWGQIIAELVPGEDNVIPNNIDLYLGSHYSVRKKDDGKLLYSWGQAVKKPTDIRFVAHLPLPEEWKTAEGKGLKVTKAQLRVKHSITNNPNDQIRPEDWENEGATGLVPEYEVADDGTWRSTRGCYEGDGDFIPAGTVLRDPSLAIPGALSSDLAGGYSNAWYTTIDRDPFAWAYKTADGDMVGSQTPDNTLGKLIVGPRWRLLNDKFGQNLPHLEMPAPVATDPNNPACVAPPYEKEDKKFETGDVLDDPTTINLLDWKQTAADARWDDAQSPLAYTSGWTTTWSGLDTVAGQVVTDADSGRCHVGSAQDGSCVTTNGTALTSDFDVAFFVKGDMKPVQMYWVELDVETEDGQQYTVRHNFTTDDIVADDLGTTDIEDVNVIKDGDDGETVVGDTMVGKLDGSQTSAVLNPMDSGFTYGIEDFEGAYVQGRDGVAEEGWALDYTDNKGTVDDPSDDETALLLADNETQLMKTLNLVGTWGAGLGGSTVKTSSEQFTVMEHVLSCYQTVPYTFWKSEDDYVDGLPAVPEAWDPQVCEATQLPNPFTADAFLPPEPPMPVLGTEEDGTDGVLMPSELVAGSSYTIPVAVDGSGTITAAFDWNDDGDFADASEALEPIEGAQGQRQVPLAVPSNAAVGMISAEFTVASPSGAVGEVEKYEVMIKAAPEPPAQVKAKVTRKSTVTVKAIRNRSKLFVDVNPDEGKGYWIKVFRKGAGKANAATWRKSGKTLWITSKDGTHTIDLPKGTYRVKVRAKYGLKSTVSQQVRLAR